MIPLGAFVFAAGALALAGVAAGLLAALAALGITLYWRRQRAHVARRPVPVTFVDEWPGRTRSESPR